ncbi:hypothetical protein [Mitsuokella sp.]
MGAVQLLYPRPLLCPAEFRYLYCYKLDQLYPRIMRDLVARAARGED